MAVNQPAADDLIDGRYRLIEPLGQGGTATVWRGRDERLARTVAVKVVAGKGSGRSAQEEARALARLAHPCVAGIFDYGVHRGSAYLVLELVDGPSLAEVDGMPRPAVIAAGAQIADALAAAHARGIVHRDVTPANVMLTRDGIKLIDFGISALSGNSELDADGELRGTPAYAAPERLRAGTVEPPSDMYSFGFVLKKLLSRTADVPPAIEQLCARCLAPDPAERPTAGEAAEILAEVAEPNALADYASSAVDSDRTFTRVIALPATQPHRDRSAARLAVVAVLAALIFLTAWTAIGRGADAPFTAPQEIVAPQVMASPAAVEGPAAAAAVHRAAKPQSAARVKRVKTAAKPAAPVRAKPVAPPPGQSKPKPHKGGATSHGKKNGH
jgi:eukaryotic-like serine/threonine-protein kinase